LDPIRQQQSSLGAHVPNTNRTTTGAGLGIGGQHSEMPEAWFAHTAGLKVEQSNPTDDYGLLTPCIFDDDPCIFLEPLGNSFAHMKFCPNRAIV
jgi:pyruvate dehydrogenase E1 component beta subunit